MVQNCPDQIQQWMEFALEFINPEYKTGLDFSMESLKLANQCLGELKAGMKDWPQNDFQQILNMVVLDWGGLYWGGGAPLRSGLELGLSRPVNGGTPATGP